MLRQLTLIAVAGYVTGLTLGLGICHAVWVAASHETRYRLTWRNT